MQSKTGRLAPQVRIEPSAIAMAVCIQPPLAPLSLDSATAVGTTRSSAVPSHSWP